MMKIKIINFRLAFLTTIFLIIFQTNSSVVLANLEYSDLSDPNYIYYKAIKEFTDQGILEGYADGTFKPQQPISRAEALKVIIKAFNIESNDSKDNNLKEFSDIDTNQWYYPYIVAGLKNNIIEGYTDGTFKPGNQVLMAEALKMGVYAKGIDINSLEYTEFHPSIKQEDWFAKIFSYGYKKLIYELDANGSINPLKEYTRGEFTDLIYRLTQTSKEINDPFDITYNWKQDTTNAGLEVSYPLDWGRYTMGDGLFLGFFGSNKPSFLNTPSNSARVSVNYWKNQDPILNTSQSYFDDLTQRLRQEYKDYNLKITQTETDLGPSLNFEAEEIGIMNRYIFLSDRNILIAEGNYDPNSLKKVEFKIEIQNIFENLGSINNSSTLSLQQKIELARLNVLVRGKGQEILNLFENKELFETDTLGVGTGPVDYYYIQEINLTLVYERNTNTIWAVSEGKTNVY